LFRRLSFIFLSFVNHRLTNLDPIDLNQPGFQANPLFACIITFVERENVLRQVAESKTKQHFLVLVYGFLATAYKVRCLLTGDSGIKAHIGRVVGGAAQCIDHHADKSTIEGFNSANVAQITQALDVEIEVFSFGRSSVGVVCSVIGSGSSHDVYSGSGKV
jgi:hypothetical protein